MREGDCHIVNFRVDSSFQIGSGHVMRCLTLASEFKKCGIKSHFICRNLPGHMGTTILRHNHSLVLLPTPEKEVVTFEDSPKHAHWLAVPWEQDADETKCAISSQSDFLVVDHYGIDYRWHRKLRTAAIKILVIDDLADRKYDCDLLLDQTYGRNKQAYLSLVPDECCLLLGSNYALLRPEFARERFHSLQKHRQAEDVRRILVFMGGMDPDNITAMVLDSLAQISLFDRSIVDIVLSRNSPNLKFLRKKLKECSFQVNILLNVINMSELMRSADLAIGGGGTASWERCCLGLPALLVVLADNQKNVASSLALENAVINLGTVENLNTDKISTALKDIFNDREKRRKMSIAAAKICDGLGVKRVKQKILPMRLNDGAELSLRPVTMNDAARMFRWQTTDSVRKYSRNPQPPEWEQHVKWLAGKLKNSECLFNIIELDDQAVGLIRLDRIKGEDELSEISIVVDPEIQGKGLAFGGLKLVRDMIPHSIIIADVHPDNIASHKLFKKSGYKKIGQRTYILK